MVKRGRYHRQREWFNHYRLRSQTTIKDKRNYCLTQCAGVCVSSAFFAQSLVVLECVFDELAMNKSQLAFAVFVPVFGFSTIVTAVLLAVTTGATGADRVMSNWQLPVLAVVFALIVTAASVPVAIVAGRRFEFVKGIGQLLIVVFVLAQSALFGVLGLPIVNVVLDNSSVVKRKVEVVERITLRNRSNATRYRARFLSWRTPGAIDDVPVQAEWNINKGSWLVLSARKGLFGCEWIEKVEPIL